MCEYKPIPLSDKDKELIEMMQKDIEKINSSLQIPAKYMMGVDLAKGLDTSFLTRVEITNIRSRLYFKRV